jgi:hypothetical protein
MKEKPEHRALKYLISRRWQYDDEKVSAMQLKKAFTHKKFNDRQVLGDAITYLIRECDWNIYSLNDIRNLDKARRIFQKYNKDE